jgi:hypothetical protein
MFVPVDHVEAVIVWRTGPSWRAISSSSWSRRRRRMGTAEHAWRHALDRMSIADLAARIDADGTGTAMADLRDWLASR